VRAGDPGHRVRGLDARSRVDASIPERRCRWLRVTTASPAGAPDADAGERTLGPRVLVGAGALAVAASVLGGLLGPSLIEDHPAALLAIDSRNRHLALATATALPAWAFLVIGLVRLTIADPVFYRLGRRHGSVALRRLDREAPALARQVRRAERLLEGRWGLPTVLVAPNYVVSAAAGHVRMAGLTFALLNLTGTVGRLWLIWTVGRTFATPVDWLLQAVTEHRVAITLVLAGLLLARARRLRSTAGS